MLLAPNDTKAIQSAFLVLQVFVLQHINALVAFLSLCLYEELHCALVVGAVKFGASIIALFLLDTCILLVNPYLIMIFLFL